MQADALPAPNASSPSHRSQQDPSWTRPEACPREPEVFSNPLPGSHGMPSTLRIPPLVAGGSADAPPADADAATRDGFDRRALSEAVTARPDACVRARAAAPGRPAAAPSASSPSPATAAPRPDSGTLPATGPQVPLPLAGLLVLGCGLVLRRRAGV